MDSEDDGEIAILVAAAEAAEQQQGEKRRREAERSMRRRAASALEKGRPVGQNGRPRYRPGSACSDPGADRPPLTPPPLPAGMPAGIPRLEPRPPPPEPPNPPGPGAVWVPGAIWAERRPHELWSQDDAWVMMPRDTYLYLRQLEDMVRGDVREDDGGPLWDITRNMCIADYAVRAALAPRPSPLA